MLTNLMLVKEEIERPDLFISLGSQVGIINEGGLERQIATEVHPSCH